MLDNDYLAKISESFPAIGLEDNDLPSFKYNLLKNLSWNGEDIIRNHKYYGFDDDIFPSIRYEVIKGWDTFRTFSEYTGPVYDILKHFVVIAKKILYSPDYEDLFDLKQEYLKLYSTIHIRVEKDVLVEPKEILQLFVYNETYDDDYNCKIIYNLLEKRELKCLIKNRKNLPNVGGLYKSILAIFQGAFKIPFSNEQLVEILDGVRKPQRQYISPIQLLIRKNDDPLIYWPWFNINYLRHKMMLYGKQHCLLE